MFLGGLIVFTLGSIGAGLSGSINELVAFRGVQGAGAAFLMPGTLSILTHTFSGKDLGRALGLWAGISGLALGMGPVVGGLLVEKAGWEWIFFLNVPVAVVAVPLTMWAVRESRDETAIKRVDVPGILSLSIGLGGLVLGLVQANDYGWTSGRILTEFAVGVVSLAAFIVLQLRGRDPMLNMDFFRNRTFNAGNVVAFLVTFSMFATFFFITLYMQNVEGLSPLQTGVRFLPMTILIIGTAPVAGKLSDRFGSRGLLTLGMTLVSASLSARVAYQRHERLPDPAARVHRRRPGDGNDDVADDRGRDELGRPHEGGRSQRRAVDDADDRRRVRRCQPDRDLRAPLEGAGGRRASLGRRVHLLALAQPAVLRGCRPGGRGGRIRLHPHP